MEVLYDKLSIKNLLFTKSLPNYVIPVPVNGHKVYTCTDCGDKFVFESSYNEHVNRKSLKISYMCRHCNRLKFFFNRCNLLFHIRSHVFKTATINVTDLKVEPLPLTAFKMNLLKPSDISSPSIIATETPAGTRKLSSTSVCCLECKVNLNKTGVAYKDRAGHYMQYTNEVYSCPICLFALPSTCGLKSHLRLHLKCPPYYCPECGVHLANKNVSYPYNHDCEGFKMMRATARLNCAGPNCRLFHPNDYKDHMKEFHMKKVFKCPYCVVACFNDVTMQKHMKCHQTQTKSLVFYQCELCPGKFVMQTHMEIHLRSHTTNSVYPCWPCGAVYTDVSVLLYHFKRKHNKNDTINDTLAKILNEYEMYSTKPKRIYRVVKRCDLCKRSFTYKCKYDDINILPNECPYKCSSSTMELDVMPDSVHSNTNITCHLCKRTISEDWNEIKKHYAALHKSYKCMDPEIVLTRIDMAKYLAQRKIRSSRSSNKTHNKKITRKSKKRQSNKPPISKRTLPNVKVYKGHASKSNKVDGPLFICNLCGNNYENKLSLEKHLIFHRDPCMAYQCMECGQSFVVKPSFSKHLLLEHNISDSENYITSKQCYNKTALMKYQNGIVTSNEPVGENQCKICREEFEGPEDLEKHFRVHGMAFLLKNTSTKIHN